MVKQVTSPKRSAALGRLIRINQTAAAVLFTSMLFCPPAPAQGWSDGHTSHNEMREPCDPSSLLGKTVTLIEASTQLHTYIVAIKFPEVMDGKSNPRLFIKEDEELMGSAETKINCSAVDGVTEDVATIFASIKLISGDAEVKIKNSKDREPLELKEPDASKFFCPPRGPCDGFLYGPPSALPGGRVVHPKWENILVNREEVWHFYIRNGTHYDSLPVTPPIETSSVPLAALRRNAHQDPAQIGAPGGTASISESSFYTGCDGQPATKQLRFSVVSRNASTGVIVINGVDIRTPATPFTWEWGDDTTTQGWFPQSHTYSDLRHDYKLRVISHEDDGSTDCAQMVLASTALSLTSAVAAGGAAHREGTTEVTAEAQCTGPGDPGVLSGARGIGTVRIVSGSETFAGISRENKTVKVDPGSALRGAIALRVLNQGPAFAMAPLIDTPSWGRHQDSWKLISNLRPGESTWNAQIDERAPVESGVYYMVFAFNLETNGASVASGTNWAAGQPVWDDGNDLAQLNSSQILQAQQFGCVVNRWLTEDGSKLIYVPADAITIEVTPSSTNGSVSPRSDDTSSAAMSVLRSGHSQTSVANVAAPKPDLVIQAGHAGPIFSVAFSPDGRTLASGSGDNTVKLWEVASARELRSLNGHRSGVLSVAFSPDGRTLATGASGGGDDSIKLWDVATGRELRTLAGHGIGTWVDAVSFSPDGLLLATASRHMLIGGHNDNIKLWEVATGRELRTLTGHTDWVTSVAFSPEGNLLVSGSRDKTIKVWDVASGRELRTLVGHSAGVSSVAFSPDGLLLASGSELFPRYDQAPNASTSARRQVPSGTIDTTVKLWDVASGRELRTLVGHSAGVSSVAFSPDGRLVVSSSTGDETIRLWEVATGRMLRTLTDAGYVQQVAFAPDGQTFASARVDNTVVVWEVSSGLALRTFGSRVSGVTHVSLSPDGRILASSGGCDTWIFASSQSRDATVKLWDLAGGHYLQTFWGHTKPACAVAFSPDGRTLASGSRDNTVKLWDAATGRELQTMHPSTGVGGVAFSPDGQVLASGSGSNTVNLWDVASGRQLRILSGHNDGTFGVTFSPDGRLLAGEGPRDTVELWDIASGEVLHTLTGPIRYIYSIAFSPDSKLLAWGGTDDSIELWDVAAGRELHALGHHQAGPVVLSLAFSPDDGLLASGGIDNKVTLWDVASGREVRSMVGHTASVESVAFSPDGRWLYSGSRDGSLRVWDPHSGEPIATLISMRESDDWLVVTPDGLFDGSERGMRELLCWRMGTRLYPADRFFADYYTPGLLSRILAGQRPKPDVEMTSLKLPPDVHIQSPANFTTTKQDRVVVTLDAEDVGGGLAEVRLYQNGKLVGTREGTHGAKTSTYSFDVKLVPGENVLRATALSNDRVESNDSSVQAVLDVPHSTKPVLHLLVIGINKYEDPGLNLKYARQDGTALAQFFAGRGNKLFASVDTITLFDDQATQVSIQHALEKLAREAKPEDVFLFYLAGHGVGLDQQFYFLPHEMRLDGDDEQAVRKYGISAAALGESLRRIPALKEVLILDACQSETALPILAKLVTFRGLGAAERKATEMLARSTGVYLIAASTKEQDALEVPELGHGVLAYALLSGLGEKGDPQAPVSTEGTVTMLSLLQYVNQQVPALTEKYHHNKQYPVSFTTGMDFPLLLK